MMQQGDSRGAAPRHSRKPSFSKRLHEVLAEAKSYQQLDDAEEGRADAAANHTPRAPDGPRSSDAAVSRAWGHVKFVCVILWKSIPRALPKVAAFADLVVCTLLFFVAELQQRLAIQLPSCYCHRLPTIEQR